MDFKTAYPEFAAVEEHIRRAHAERSVYLAYVIAGAIETVTRGLKRMAASMGANLAAERDRRAVEADAFLKRSVPRY
jgi:ABC-type arginine/histidine transport system permease subunit